LYSFQTVVLDMFTTILLWEEGMINEIRSSASF